MSEVTAVTSGQYKAEHKNPICEICGKERPLAYYDSEGNISEVDLQDPYAAVVTCKEHREYQFFNNIWASKAMAGFGGSEYTQEMIDSLRNGLIDSKKYHNDILQLVMDNMPQPHADKVVSYIQAHIRGYES